MADPQADTRAAAETARRLRAQVRGLERQVRVLEQTLRVEQTARALAEQNLRTAGRLCAWGGSRTGRAG